MRINGSVRSRAAGGRAGSAERAPARRSLVAGNGRRILIVDDEAIVRRTLAAELHGKGYSVDEAASGPECLSRVGDAEVDLVLLDQKLGENDGLDVLRELAAKAPDTLVIMVTGFGSIDSAVQATKLGAYDYLTKPLDMEEVSIRVKRALETTELRGELKRYREAHRSQFGLASLVGKSRSMRQLREQVKRIASSGASTVLICGESGTGKDVLARAIHYESDRARQPFVNVTCTAIPEALLESEIFGHERGAFTDAHASKKGLFELGRGGTILLDEIGDMPTALQAKLLRFLEERRFRRVGGTQDIGVDVRVIAATNRDLDDAVRKGAFRADLFYRLNVIRLELPPLRERASDIPLLAQSILERFRSETTVRASGITPEALRALSAHSWPGNIRELRNALERAVILGRGPLIDVADLPPEIVSRRDGGRAAASALLKMPAEGVPLDELEAAVIRQALERAGGNQCSAARMLGITRDRLRSRMQRIGLLRRPSRVRPKR